MALGRCFDLRQDSELAVFRKKLCFEQILFRMQVFGRWDRGPKHPVDSALDYRTSSDRAYSRG